MERVRADLQREVGREPTIGEWSRAVGMEQNAFELRLKDGRSSKDKMVNSNLRLVVSIAKNYQGRGMTLQDLIQVRCQPFEHFVSDFRFPVLSYFISGLEP